MRWAVCRASSKLLAPAPRDARRNLRRARRYLSRALRLDPLNEALKRAEPGPEESDRG